MNHNRLTTAAWWLALMVILAVNVGASDGDASCATVGSNPCCPWNASNNCIVPGDAESTCNQPPANGQPGTGAYSPACSAYLEKCVEPWMQSATKAMHGYIATNYQAFLQDLNTQNPNINDLAYRIINAPWKAFNPGDGKCMSAGFENGKYIGIYNCGSSYERSSILICKDKSRDLFAGAVTVYPLDAKCPSGSVPSNGECIFNIYLKDSNNVFQKSASLNEPFDVQLRPWFVKAKADRNYGASPLWLPPYKNYDTGHPVFGYTQGIFQGQIFTSAALVLQFVADNPSYKTFNKNCLP